MSKKMLKRSLALGALMAFVITGSAMAAGEPYNKQIITSSDCKEISNATDGGSKEYGAITDDLTYVGEAGKVTIQTNYNNSSITLKGNTLNVTTNVADVVLTTSGTNDSKISLTADKSIKISGLVIGNGNNNTIGLEAGTDIEVTGGIKTYGGSNNITLRATNGCIKTTGIVETNAPKSNIELIGNSVEIVATVADAIKTYGKGSEIAVKGTNGTTVNGHVIIDGGATGSSIIVGDGGDTTIKGDVKTWGKDSNITIDGGNTTEINGWVVAYGDGSNITLSSNENLNVNGVVQAFSYQQDNAVTNKIRVDMNAKNIVVDAKGFDNAVYTVCDFWKLTSDEAVINLGNDSTEKIEIKNFSEHGLYSAMEGSGIIVKANELKIYSDKEESVGIYVANGTYEGNWGNENTENNARVLIGKNTVTTIDVKDTAIEAMSEGVVDIKGDLTATAKNAILARGNATVNINDDGQGNSLGSTVVLNGDIAFDYDGVTSQTPVDANVNVNLDGAASSWTGSTTMYENGVKLEIGMSENGTIGLPDDDTNSNVNNLKVNNFTIGLSNGATWIVTEKGFVNEVIGNGGTVVLATQGEDVSDENLKVATASIGKNTNSDLTVSGDDKLTKAIEAGKVSADKALGALNDAAKVKDEDNSQDIATVKTAEGKILGSYVLTENGAELQESSKSAAVSEAGMNLKAHWRAHMNDMNKRMGELRNANGETGVWTRMVRGETEYEGAKMQYNQYQLGYDEKLSVDKRWTVGAAVTFAEGDSSYGQGSSEDKSTAFAIYGTKLNNDGTFVDLIARYARLESDIEDSVYDKGEYDTNGMSVSAEFGKRIQQGKGLWIEPQVELTYGTVDSATVRFTDGSVANYGDMDSLIGRVGFRIGKDIEQGNVYARASYLYDFDGETETTFTNGTVSGKPVEEDFGGGWWEVGVGANINLSKATYVYADVEKTFGGEVDTNWQWNLGVRYSF